MRGEVVVISYMNHVTGILEHKINLCIIMEREAKEVIPCIKKASRPLVSEENIKFHKNFRSKKKKLN